MKKTIKNLSLVLGLAIVAVACGSKSDLDGYKKTETGLYYKFITENKTGKQVQKDDILVGEWEVKLEGDSVPFISTFGQPGRFQQALSSAFKGDINEGFLMMHTGEEASFAVFADSMAKYYIPGLEQKFEQGKEVKMYFKIKLESTISKAEVEKEMEIAQQQAMQAEIDSLKSYLATNKITQAPTESGLYIIVKKKGNGAKAVAGKNVKMNYTGKFLTGKVFDTSSEKVAKEQGIFQQGRPYEPLAFVLGQGQMIPGVDEAVATMSTGGIIDVVIPSKMAYGPRGNQGIPPYSPLVFTIELVSVE